MNQDLYNYILGHMDPEPEELHQLERRTNIRLINGRMCSGHLQGRLLRMLVAIANPRDVLELGTFSGYSALCIAEGLQPGAKLTTVEADDELEDFIRDSFSRLPYGDSINLVIDDAMHFCATQPDASYDLIFMDADKRQYCDYYDQAMRLLRPGGLLIADNTLWDGHVVEPDHAHDPQTKAIKRFNDKVADDPNVQKVILPLRDGLTLIRKLNTDQTR